MDCLGCSFFLEICLQDVILSVQKLGVDVEFVVLKDFLEFGVLDLEFDHCFGDFEFLFLRLDEFALNVCLGLDDVVEFGLHFLHFVDETGLFVSHFHLFEIFFDQLLLEFCDFEVVVIRVVAWEHVD